MISESQAKLILTKRLNVSHETMNDLCILVEMLKKWNKTINLVSKSTIEDVWLRHIVDSAQMWQYRPKDLKAWVDLGSGGGFPGLVLAILAKHESPHTIFHLVESDARKCAFLRNVSRETTLNTEIHNCRIENTENIMATVVSARALAPVGRLFEYSQRFLADNAYCLFLKGRACANEVKIAEKSWLFQSEATESLSDNSGVIFKAWNMQRVND